MLNVTLRLPRDADEISAFVDQMIPPWKPAKGKRDRTLVERAERAAGGRGIFRGKAQGL